MSVLTDAELYALTVRHFGDLGPDVVNTMFQIAKRESGGNTTAYNGTGQDNSHGLWQINTHPNANPDLARYDLNDPEQNATAARIVYDRAGPQAWSTYNGGPMSPPKDPWDQLINGAIEDAAGGGGSSASLQGESLPGLVFDPNTGKYYVAGTGREATQSEITSAQQRKNAMTPSEIATLDAQRRGQAVTIRGQDLGYASDQASLAQRAYEFDQSQAFAKEQWLFQKENEIQQLDLQRQQLATTQANNARQYSLETEKLDFVKDQFAFESGMALRKESRETQAQLFQQQATVAGLQLEMANISSQVAQTNARIQSEVAMFNAGKAADVSMFNIDQKTKVATFNAEMAYNAQTFNAQMGFEVQKANVENERLRQQQLIDVASRLSEAAKNPGDWGALAALVTALGHEGGFGATDAGLANADLRTNDSLMPIEAMLRQREDILSSEKNPFSFTPVTAPVVPTPEAATFTPAAASLAPKPDFSGVKLPTPNTTPFDPNSIPTSAPKTNRGPDAAKQKYIATGQDTVPTQDFQNWDTAEARAQIPDIALQMLMDSGYIPNMAEGGLVNNGMVTPFSNFGRRNEASIQPVPNQGMNINWSFGGNGDAATPTWPQMPQGGMGGGMQRPPLPEWTQNVAGQVEGMRNNLWERVRNPGAAPTWPGMPQQGGQPGGQPPQNPMDGMQQRWQQWLAQLPPEYLTRIQQFLAQRQQAGGQMPQGWGMPGAAAEGGMMQGAFVAGEANVEHPEELIFPLGPGMALVLPPKETQKAMKGGKAKSAPKMAQGGLYEEQGKSMYEGLVGDQDRTRATNFLNEALMRSTVRTPWGPGKVPTPVYFSSPGTPSFLTQMGSAIAALKSGVPMSYFQELAAQQAPTGFSEGVIGRTR